MDQAVSLNHHLARYAAAGGLSGAVADVVEALAEVAAEVAEIVSFGALAGVVGAACGRNTDGDIQKDIDIRAHTLFRDMLRDGPVAAFASEEAESVEFWDREAPLCVAIDPIDGSANIDVNMPVGTIFSILPTPHDVRAPSAAVGPFIWPAGQSQVAAGFIVYGPQTTLVLTLGDSVDVFTLNRRTGSFSMTRGNIRLPAGVPDEYAINASNYRHWEEPVRSYIDDCLAGVDGPFGRDFNMRWHGALVAETYRILTRGGIFLYPADGRKAYRNGRLRLVYEAYPMAFLLERAGGAASTGRCRILDLEPTALHQRVPLVLGSAAPVKWIEQLHGRQGLWPQTAAPLFASRGLFRV
jgi:fructose-1,6-bisphosphatase I